MQVITTHTILDNNDFEMSTLYRNCMKRIQYTQLRQAAEEHLNSEASSQVKSPEMQQISATGDRGYS
jgi:hypothetical protein